MHIKTLERYLIDINGSELKRLSTRAIDFKKKQKADRWNVVRERKIIHKTGSGRNNVIYKEEILYNNKPKK